MLYAQVDKKRWDDIPSEWDEVRAMFQYLHRMVFNYQVTFEARMFNSGEYPQYRCTLIKWNDKRYTEANKREVLLETTDPEQMKAALLMLISEAEPEYKAKNRVAWVRHEL
jgi:hypothetical protein